MKRTLPVILGIALLALTTYSRAGDLPAGQVDFGTFTPPGEGGEFVEVNLPSNLISLAAKFIEKQEPDVAQLLNRIHLVHVNVIGVNEQNRAELEQRAKKVRQDLEKKGWERIVTVVKQDENVGVYLKTQGKDNVQGLAVVVLEGKQQAVFANIVGDIKPEQLALLGDRLHLDPLKKLGHLTPEKAEQ